MQISLFQSSMFRFLVPVTIVFGLAGFSMSSWVKNVEGFSQGLIIDFALTLPLAYLWSIWQTKIPKISVVPVFILSLFIASKLLPAENQTLISQIQTIVIPVAELVVFGFAILKVVHIRKAFKSQQKRHSDILDSFSQVFSELLGSKRMAELLSTEIGMFYYVSFGWKKPVYSGSDFTIHKKSGIGAIVGSITFLILAETLIVHLLIMESYPIVAWIIFGLSMYTVLQFLAHLLSLKHRPHYFDGDQLILRNGLFSKCAVPLSLINSVSMSKKTTDDGRLKVALLEALEPHNVVVDLSDSVEVKGMFGITKSSDKICFWADDANGMLKRVEGMKKEIES